MTGPGERQDWDLELIKEDRIERKIEGPLGNEVVIMGDAAAL